VFWSQVHELVRNSEDLHIYLVTQDKKIKRNDHTHAPLSKLIYICDEFSTPPTFLQHIYPRAEHWETLHPFNTHTHTHTHTRQLNEHHAIVVFSMLI